MKKITECGIDGSPDFQTLWELPNLPLTERFGKYSPEKQLAFDQELVISTSSGHVQLRNQISPDILYTKSNYNYSTSTSDKARADVDVFVAFMDKVLKGKNVASILDIGGNDLYVAKKLKGRAKEIAVIDPVLADRDGQVEDGIKILGKFIEDVTISNEMALPEAVVCRHTLEHISNPRKSILRWMEECHPECIFFVEIPCFENLMESLRFDAVFHQHYHYFDIESLRLLVYLCGGEIIDYYHTRPGSCGGSLTIAFKRAGNDIIKPEVNAEKKYDYAKKRLGLYLNQMEITMELIANAPKPLYGFGGGLMLATLGYHLRTDFSGFDCILDDDPLKHDMGYENIPVTVKNTAKVSPPTNSTYLITSLESIRPIYKRILELKPRRIIAPIIN